jgi:hypothetical protein
MSLLLGDFAASIIEDLQGALEQFAALTEDLVSPPLSANDHP